MTVKDASGNTQSKAQVDALKTAVTPVQFYTFAAPLYATFPLAGEDRSKNYESGLKKVLIPGVQYTQAQIDALFESAATVTSVSPNSGVAAGGVKVTITGTNLEGVSGVTFGGTAATNVKSVNDTTVTCTTPAHATGAVNVVVTDDVSGNVTLTNGYTYV